MPKTKFQDLIFTLLMVFTMVYIMTLYNMSLELGFSNSLFFIALKGMWVEAALAFFAQRYLAGPIAKKLTFKFFPPESSNQLFIILAMAGFTVYIMAPVMTFLVNIYHNGITSHLIEQWIPKLVVNFPFALFIQIFIAGPVVRRVFRLIFVHMKKEKSAFDECNID